MEANEKKEIRRIVLELRRQMQDRNVLCRSREIFRKVEESSEYRRTDAVFVYMDVRHEVMTGEFIERALRDGKKVAVPKVDGNRMNFLYISSTDDCRPGKMGIPEPFADAGTGHDLQNADADETALMILPGVAFDSSCRRVGYGGGYYDRYLAEHRFHPTVAVAFDEQIFDRVPGDAHDICPQTIITPTRVFVSQKIAPHSL